MHRRTFLTATTAAIAAASIGRSYAAQNDGMTVAVIGHTGRGDYGHELDTLWLNVPGVKVVAVADPVEEGLMKAAKRLGDVKTFGDYRKMLNEVKPDIVSVAPRWVDQHAEMVIAAAEAGAKGIYAEKPFARNLEEADAMIAACEKAGTQLAVAHRMRYHPVLKVVNSLIDEGKIGKVLEIRGRGKEDHRGGVQDLWVLGSHVFNLINHVAGAAATCSANIYVDGKLVTESDLKEGPEGIGPMAGSEVHARFRMENGITTYFDSIKEAGTPAAGFGLQIIGNDGVINLRVDREPFAFISEGSPFDETNPGPWKAISSGGIDVPEPIENLGKQVGSHLIPALDLIEAIKENRPPICDGKEARQNIAMIQAVTESHFANKTVEVG